MDDYKLYRVVMVDPDNLEKHEFEYLAEDSNDAWGYALHDHPDYNVKTVVEVE